MKVGPHTVIKRSSNVPWRTIEGKGILVDLDSGYYFSLNRTGQAIWAEIDGGKPLSEIAGRIEDRFDVDGEIALRDCMELAEKLLEQGLVVTVSS